MPSPGVDPPGVEPPGVVPPSSGPESSPATVMTSVCESPSASGAPARAAAARPDRRSTGAGTAATAVIVTRYVPAEPGAGVPAMTAVPSPSSVNVRPAGSVPVRVSAGSGVPVARTTNRPAEPSANGAASGLVMTGARVTSTRSVCVLVPAALVAVSSTVTGPSSVGVPAIVAVPSPWSVNVSPAGSVPASVSAASG